MRSLWMVAALLLIAPPGRTAEPADPWAAFGRFGVPRTMGEVDTIIQGAKSFTWTLPEMLRHPPADQDGRRMEDDVADYLFAPPALAQLDKARQELAATTPTAGGFPESSLRQLQEVLAAQNCRGFVLMRYWSGAEALDYHRGMIVAIIDRMPAMDQPAARAELDSLDKGAETGRQRIASNMQACDAFEISPRALQTSPADPYNKLRQQLAGQLEKARSGLPQSTRRSKPCPAPATRTSGKPYPSNVSRPDFSEYYPLEARGRDVSGVGRIRIEVDQAGCAASASVATSTGAEILDAAAVQYALDLEFLPAEEDGKATTVFVILPVTFSMEWQRPAQAQP